MADNAFLALGLQKLLALVILRPAPAQRAGLAGFVGQLLDGAPADERFQLGAGTATQEESVGDVVAVCELEDAGLTAQADALAGEPQLDRRWFMPAIRLSTVSAAWAPSGPAA